MRGRLWIVVLILLLLGSAGAAYYFYDQNQKILKDPNGPAKKEAQNLTTEVGKVIELPAGEEPTVATIADKTKLQDQQFFASAENGDKVLIYTQAKKAILYRPSTHKVIEVGPVNIKANDQTDGTTTPTTTPKK